MVHRFEGRSILDSCCRCWQKHVTHSHTHIPCVHLQWNDTLTKWSSYAKTYAKHRCSQPFSTIAYVYIQKFSGRLSRNSNQRCAERLWWNGAWNSSRLFVFGSDMFVIVYLRGISRKYGKKTLYTDAKSVCVLNFNAFLSARTEKRRKLYKKKFHRSVQL